MSRSRTWLLALAALVVLAALGVVHQLSREDTGHDRPAAVAAPPKRTVHADVVFIVTDMVRADRLSACGYTRPTSPVLARLAAEEGVAFTCDARSPGTWTLPSHASFFTGEEVPTHGADCLADAEGERAVSLWGDMVRPLREDLPTLAERMAERGMETVLVSGNPIVSRRAATGLDRGFEVVRASVGFGDRYGDALIADLEDALDETPSKGPIFLFVNIADAHHPWLAVPDGLGWLSPRPFLDNRPRLPDNPYPRFFRNQMSREERAAFLEHAGDSYDYAVHRADNTLGKVLDVLSRRGLSGEEDRLVVTSDHGEFLGEHDLLSHGIFVYEPDTRVPMLFRPSRGDGPAREAAIELGAGPISAITAHDLALDGRLPVRPRPVRAAGYPDGLLSRLFGARLTATTAAVWRGREKAMYLNGELSLFDLGSDPGEERPAPLSQDHPMRAELVGFARSVIEAESRAAAPSPQMIEALRALGYVE